MKGNAIMPQIALFQTTRRDTDATMTPADPRKRMSASAISVITFMGALGK